MATYTTSYNLATIIEAHNELQRCERNVESARRWVNDLARKGERLDIAEHRLATSKKCLRSAKKAYRALASEVRVYDLATGKLVGVQTDKSRSIGYDFEVEVEVDADYEREAEAVAAALYECGHLDF